LKGDLAPIFCSIGSLYELDTIVWTKLNANAAHGVALMQLENFMQIESKLGENGWSM
jgi:hypothetical protein